jgi:hypothetical protein
MVGAATMMRHMKRTINERPFFVDDEVKESKAEIARLRGIIRAIKHIAKINLRFTPESMLK